MPFATKPRASSERLTMRRVRPAQLVPSLLDDARAGLLSAPRSLPPKYFYDARGAALFDRICDTPEYYLTRTEEKLLVNHAETVIAAVEPAEIIEIGSGSARKTRHLLDAAAKRGRTPVFAPFDINESLLIAVGRDLSRDYDWLDVRLLVGDYEAGLADLVRGAAPGPRLFVFLGSTIGNFVPARALDFLADLRARMAGRDRLLLGADRVKDHGVLNAAYNDAAGVTAAFNLNLLHVLNRGLGANFAPDGFDHHALFNPAKARIEMYLVARCAQSVNLTALGRGIEIESGERILTELSHKYSEHSLERLLRAAGFAIERHFQPENGYFSLVLARPVTAKA